MLNPVVIPLPMALLAMLLATAAMVYRRWLDSDATWNPVARLFISSPATHGRHRLADASEPFRDWASLAAERLTRPTEAQRPALIFIPGGASDWTQPLTDFERRAGVIEIAGHDDHAVPSDDDTRELEMVP